MCPASRGSPSGWQLTILHVVAMWGVDLLLTDVENSVLQNCNNLPYSEPSS